MHGERGAREATCGSHIRALRVERRARRWMELTARMGTHSPRRRSTFIHFASRREF